MTTLGDSLLAKGQLYAAQFCYIVSGAEWGTFAKKGSKLVLLCAQVLTFVLLGGNMLFTMCLSGWGLDCRSVCNDRGDPVHRGV